MPGESAGQGLESRNQRPGSTVKRLSASLGRQAVPKQTVDEPIVFDHFETFVFSQDDRHGISSWVDQRSSIRRRIGRAGPRAARRREPTRPLVQTVPGSVVRSTRQMFAVDLLHRLPAAHPG